jgi:predicted site-specific integrase-resolvase
MPFAALREELEKTLPSILNIMDICSILTVSPDTIYREIQDGKLIAFKAEGEWNVLKGDLLEYMERRSTI